MAGQAESVIAVLGRDDIGGEQAFMCASARAYCVGWSLGWDQI